MGITSSLSLPSPNIDVIAPIGVFLFFGLLFYCLPNLLWCKTTRSSVEAEYNQAWRDGYLQRATLRDDCLFLEGCSSMFSTELPINPAILTNFMAAEEFVLCVRSINDAVMDAAVTLPMCYHPGQKDARSQVVFDAARAAALALNVRHPNLQFIVENGPRILTDVTYHSDSNGNGVSTTSIKRVNLYIRRI